MGATSNSSYRVSAAFEKALHEQLSILFVLIGWTRAYDGTEQVVGGHAWLRANPEDNWERAAFKPDSRRGRFTCGVGHGSLDCDRLHVVFVARDPLDRQRKVVGVYAAADIDHERSYPRASTKTALCIPFGTRPILRNWPGDQGVRRWAWRAGAPGVSHLTLRGWFTRFRSQPTVYQRAARVPVANDQVYADLELLEGVARAWLVKQRSREARLRKAKLARAFEEHGLDGLTCEVPGCGFNFARQYGERGANYAQVHHRTPLSKIGKRGRKISLNELAIVCANCHAMIHVGGGSVPLEEIRPKHRIRFT